MSKILITGANGQVGQSFKKLESNYPRHKITFASRKELDISDEDAVLNYCKKGKYDWIINCAAYTKVDLAETESDQCYLINETGAGHIAKAADAIGARIVNISSDYVYHSNFGKPFKETDLANPQSVYAKSKLAGELATAANCEQHYNIRTSWVYAEHGNNFIRTMLRLGMERDNLSVVCDQIGAPTYAHDLAQVIFQIIKKDNVPCGTYNFANSGQTTWYNLTRAIHTNEGISCLVTPIRTDEYPTAAARPPYSMMDLSKIQDALGVNIRDWEEALKDCLGKVKVLV